MPRSPNPLACTSRSNQAIATHSAPKCVHPHREARHDAPSACCAATCQYHHTAIHPSGVILSTDHPTSHPQKRKKSTLQPSAALSPRAPIRGTRKRREIFRLQRLHALTLPPAMRLSAQPLTCISRAIQAPPIFHPLRIKVGFLWRKPTLMRLWCDFDANRTRDKCARKASTRRAMGKRDATVISPPTPAAHPSVRQRKRPRKKTSTPYEQSEGLQLKR